MLERLPLRGGNWNNAADAGVFALNLNNARTDANSNIGFRPALGERQKLPAHGPASSATSKGPAVLGRVPEDMNRRRRDSRPMADPSTPPPSRKALMAKTYANLYPRIYDFERLYQSFQKARKGKRHVREVIEHGARLEEELIQLQNELIWHRYQTGPYRAFKVYEPKERQVAALPFRDRVLQHALVSVIEPIWESRFIHDSYACRPGKGTHAGADRAEAFLRQVKRTHGQASALKADISKYFQNVDHAILRRLLAKRIACRDTLALLDGIIDTWEDSPGCGIPIGNLSSQLFANIYLHELDEFVKYQLRERHYIRYMDDFIIIHPDKAHLQRLRGQIETFLWRQLRLTTNHKTQVFPVRAIAGRPLDFLGYRIWPTHRKLRKDSVRRMKRRLKRMAADYAQGRIGLAQINPRVQSWIAHARHASTWRLRGKLLGSVAFKKDRDPDA
jgi:retron-type reverse transcriptase